MPPAGLPAGARRRASRPARGQTPQAGRGPAQHIVSGARQGQAGGQARVLLPRRLRRLRRVGRASLPTGRQAAP